MVARRSGGGLDAMTRKLIPRLRRPAVLAWALAAALVPVVARREACAWSAGGWRVEAGEAAGLGRSDGAARPAPGGARGRAPRAWSTRRPAWWRPGPPRAWPPGTRRRPPAPPPPAAAGGPARRPGRPGSGTR